MANIPLKTLKFPGLDDTYTVPQIDSTLAVSGKAADAKAAGDAIAEVTEDVTALEQVIPEVEDAILATYVTDSASGTIASFPDGADGISVKSLSVDVDPVQDLHGQTNPYPAGGGKQLLNPETFGTFPVTYSGVTATLNDDGTISFSGTSTAVIYFVIKDYALLSEYGFFDADVTYKLSGYVNDDVRCLFGVYGSGVDYRATPTGVDMSFSAEQISSLRYRLAVYVNSGVNTNGMVVKPMICPASASNPSTFAPYSNICPISGWTGANVVVSPTTDAQDGTTYTIDWTTEAGTVYGGTLDVTTGVLTVDRAMVDLGTLTYDKNTVLTGYDRFYLEINDILPVASAAGVVEAISSVYAAESVNNANANPRAGLMAALTKTLFFYEESGTYSDATAFSTAMTGQKLVYKIATPQTVQLTAEEVTTLLGQNNIFADCGDVSCEYRADTKLYIDKILNA